MEGSERLAQCSPCVEYIRAHSTFRNFEHRRNFGMSVPLGIEQYYREPLTLGQTGQRIRQATIEQRAISFFLGRRSRRQRAGGNILRITYLPFAPEIRRRVQYDTHKPGREGAGCVITTNVTPRQKESLLRRIVSVFGILQNGSRETARRGGVPVYQLSESVAVARGSLLREVDVAHD